MTGPFDGAATTRAALALHAVVAAAIAVVAAVVGGAVAGGPGLVNGLVGSAFALVLLGVTAGSHLGARRFRATGPDAVLATVLVGWLAKFVLLLITMLSLRSQPWAVQGVLSGAIVTTALASLVIDAVAAGRAPRPPVHGAAPTAEECAA